MAAFDINFGNVANAINVGGAIGGAIAKRRYNNAVTALAQQTNNGYVTADDGTKLSISDPAGQQLLRQRIIQAQGILSSNLGAAGTAAPANPYAAINNAVGNMNQFAGGNLQQTALLNNTAAENNPDETARAQGQASAANQLALANDIVGNGAGAQAANAARITFQNQLPLGSGAAINEQQGVIQGINAARTNQLIAQQGGDPNAMSGASQALMGKIHSAFQAFGGGIRNAFNANDPQHAVALMNGLARIVPQSLLPAGADPNNPYRWDAANHAATVVDVQGKPVLQDGAPIMFTPQAVMNIVTNGAQGDVDAQTKAQAADAAAKKAMLAARNQTSAAAMGFLQKASLPNLGTAIRMNLETEALSGRGASRGPAATFGTPVKGTPVLTMYRDANGNTVSVAPGALSGNAPPPGEPVGASWSTQLPNGTIGHVTTETINGQTKTTVVDANGTPLFAGTPESDAARARAGIGAANADSFTARLGKISAIADAAVKQRENDILRLGAAGETGIRPEQPPSLANQSQGALMQQTELGGQSPYAASTMRLESGNNPNTPDSSAGAIGVMQVMPATGAPVVQQLQQAGVIPQGMSVEQALRNPRINQLVGNQLLTRYGAEAKQAFPSSAVAQALFVHAAYNMGEAAAVAWAQGRPYATAHGQFRPRGPFDLNALPAETRAYALHGTMLDVPDAAPTLSQLGAASATLGGTPQAVAAPVAAAAPPSLANPFAGQ